MARIVTRMARIVTRLTRMARMARTVTRMTRWLACLAEPHQHIYFLGNGLRKDSITGT